MDEYVEVSVGRPRTKRDKRIDRLKAQPRRQHHTNRKLDPPQRLPVSRYQRLPISLKDYNLPSREKRKSPIKFVRYVRMPSFVASEWCLRVFHWNLVIESVLPKEIWKLIFSYVRRYVCPLRIALK